MNSCLEAVGDDAIDRHRQRDALLVLPVRLVRVLHVLLDGTVEARTRQAMVIEDIDRATAHHRLVRVDRFRRAYLEDLYGVRVHEPGVFHLVLDSTVLALGECVELIAAAARAHAR